MRTASGIRIYKLNAYAKLNLYLDITGKRDDGYHLLETVMQSISLADEVTVVVSAGNGITLSVSREDIPTDLMTASGSGLDPHISPASAEVQIPRIVEASGLSEDEVRQIIADNTKGKTLGVFGEETVNVLGVNLDIALAMGLVGEISK